MGTASILANLRKACHWWWAVCRTSHSFPKAQLVQKSSRATLCSLVRSFREAFLSLCCSCWWFGILAASCKAMWHEFDFVMPSTGLTGVDVLNATGSIVFSFRGAASNWAFWNAIPHCLQCFAKKCNWRGCAECGVSVAFSFRGAPSWGVFWNAFSCFFTVCAMFCEQSDWRGVFNAMGPLCSVLVLLQTGL